MPHLPALLPRGARSMLILTALGYLGVAVTLKPPYPFATVIPHMPWFWQALFCATSLACVALVIRPDIRALRYVTLLMMTLAAGSRMVALVWVGRSVALAPAMAWGMLAMWQIYGWRSLILEARSNGRSWSVATHD